jgi:vacuolar-type H+-ATPase subunit I/STV1
MPAFDMDQARVKTIKKLQAENEEKEKKIKKLVEYTNSLTVQANADNDSLQEKNKKLEEKLEFQTESWEKGWETGKSDTFDEIDEAVKPLKEEIKELKEDLLYYRFYSYTLDRSGDCDLTKYDVDKFTDSKVHRKTLYDAIGYDFDPYEYGNCKSCAIPLTEDDHENGEGKCEDCCEE